MSDGDEGMTSEERRALEKVIRLRGKTARADVAARVAGVLASFEVLVDTQLTLLATLETEVLGRRDKANEGLRQRVSDLGLPMEWAPEFEVAPGDLGSRRRELMRVAKIRAEAMRRDALAQVEATEAGLLEDLAASVIASGAANTWLDEIPSADALVPALSFDNVIAALPSGSTDELLPRVVDTVPAKA